MSPLIVGLVAPLTGEPVSWPMRAGVTLAVLGAVVLAVGDAELGGGRLLGDAMAFGGAVAAAGYFLVGRRVRATVALVPYITAVYGVAAVLLALIALSTGAAMTGFDARSWGLLVLLALLPQLLGHSSFNWALAGLSATFVTVATLGEPIGSTLLAWWWLGEAPPVGALWGGALVLAGLAVAARAEARTQRTIPPAAER
jgi:drug/metabolite transporter (DMT)-like permease